MFPSLATSPATPAGMTTFIFPCNPVTGTGFDDEFRNEADIMRFDSNSQLARVDHDALVRDENPHFKVIGTAVAEGEAIYRGWMVTISQYCRLQEAVEKTGLTLFTSSKQYQSAHQIDGWFDTFEDITFPTVFISADASPAEIQSAASALNAEKFFVKDYVKSQKGDPSLSIADSIESLPATVERFIDAQGEWLAGGIVIRKFVELPADRVEMRAWWRDGEWLAFTPHPDYAGQVSGQEIPAPLLADVSARLVGLGVRFVTVDFTPTSAGGWIVIEIGDGQVSGFPAGLTDDIINNILR